MTSPAPARAEVLRRAADAVLDERAALAALMVRESGKPWDEADGEVVEAVDFLRLYASTLDHPPGEFGLPSDEHEHNQLRLLPRGVAVAITPWNFPFAIPMGIAAAAIAGGNAVVLKPAEQTPACGAAVVRLLRAAGVPVEAVGLVQGGARAGAALAAHPQVATIGFTGSVDVGLRLARTAGDTLPGQRHIKRLVAELGGKNCAIVAADADLDLAAEALIRSGFSFAGQKCSAVSRVLVERGAADALRGRLEEAVVALRVGPGADFETFVPPVIDAGAETRLNEERAAAAAAGTLIAAAQAPSSPGHYVAPALVADLPPGAAMLTDELFGPLLAFEQIDDVEDGCRRVDALSHALVGGLYTTSSDTIERVLRCSPVGNLYINRPTVGARVGRQPFGGGRLSGTGHKAGGPHYMMAFCEQQVVSHRIPLTGLSGTRARD